MNPTKEEVEEPMTFERIELPAVQGQRILAAQSGREELDGIFAGHSMWCMGLQ